MHKKNRKGLSDMLTESIGPRTEAAPEMTVLSFLVRFAREISTHAGLYLFCMCRGGYWSQDRQNSSLHIIVPPAESNLGLPPNQE